MYEQPAALVLHINREPLSVCIPANLLTSSPPASTQYAVHVELSPPMPFCCFLFSAAKTRTTSWR